jgi:hypothetical protein
MDWADEGPLHIRVTREEGVIHLLVLTPHDRLRQMFEAEAPVLRQNLAELGLQLGQLDIGREGSGSSFADFPAPSQPASPPPRAVTGPSAPRFTARSVAREGEGWSVWA